MSTPEIEIADDEASDPNTPAVPRRFFLKASVAAGGGLLLNCVLSHDTTPLAGQRAQASQLAAQSGITQSAAPQTALNAWLRIGADDQVTLICSQSEMGQGVMTTLPAVLADELGADWARVRVETSPATPAYRNPRLNWMFTGNSESTTVFFDVMRNMGASAREMLTAAAATRWGVNAAECHAEKGKVIHRPTKRVLTFGELAEAAAQVAAPQKPRLKEEREWTLIGKPLPRVETPAKLNGTAVYGLDFRTPNMVHAAVRQSPVFGGKVRSFERSSVANLPGVIDVVEVPNGVAVVAKSYWQAERAMRELKVEFDDGPHAALSSASLTEQYRAAMDGGKWKTVRAEGAFEKNPNALTAAGADVFTAEYESQFLAHATMEPMNCTAHVTPDRCRIWGPIQGAELVQLVVGQTLGLPKEKVEVERTLLGGGFGRRLAADFAVQAALVSKHTGLPIKVVWPREEDMRQDMYRPATLNRISARVNRDGKPETVLHKVVSPSILQFVFPVGVTEDLDPSCLEGLMAERPEPSSPPSGGPTALYKIPNTRVDFHLLKIGVPTSVMRTTGFGPNIFAWEGFVDELAHRAKQDPYKYRRGLIGNKRLLAVLDLAAEKADWSKPAAKDAFRGIACTEAFKTHIAHVVELSVTDGLVKINRVVCAVDAGTVLDPEITRNSIEGGTVWGLGCAFTSNITFREGRTVEGNFNAFKITRMNEVPPIEVHYIDSGARPLGGTGEVGPVTLVPAIANAIFAATGRRLRSLPLSRHGLRLA